MKAGPWLAEPVARRVTTTLNGLDGRDPAGAERWLADLVGENQRIHDEECLNLNPATNRMNPRAEAMLSARLGSRASLGYPGDPLAPVRRRGRHLRRRPDRPPL